LWTTRKEVPLPDLLIELGWITPADKADVNRLLERKLLKHAGNPKVGLAAMNADVKRSLAALQDDDILRSLADLPAPDAETTIGTVDGWVRPHDRYSLMHLHASGGIGRIWVARDRAVGRDVALKELLPQRASQSTHRARFLQEARITGQLEHPGIVPVYELSQRADDEQPFYTMRLVRGRTLREAARMYHAKRSGTDAARLEFLTLLNAFVTVCNTVAYAHSRGVIHRDLKGQNVVLGDFGEVVVLDWGLAKLVDRRDEEAELPSVVIDDGVGEGLTIQGQTVGTPAYMAPEQASGRIDEIDRHTDLYGLGAMMYEILTGLPPFAGVDTHDVLRKVRNESPIPPREIWQNVPAALEEICLRALAKKPADRPHSASELARVVQEWQEKERREAQEERDRFFTLSLDMLAISDFEGRFVRLNPAWERTLGFTIAELLSQPFISFVHPDDRRRTMDEARQIMTGVDTVIFENRYRCKDGAYKWLQWTSTPDVSRRLMYAAARDVTAQKQAVETIHKSEELYRTVIATMQDGIVIVDADGGIRACNGSAERILGLSAEQIMGRTALDPRWRAIHEDSSPFPPETFPVTVTLRTGRPCSNIVMGVYKPDGGLTWISINSQPFLDADGVTLSGVVASLEDITERRRTEAALQQASAELARLGGARQG
jgi:PAS domain S-box-containing protein